MQPIHYSLILNVLALVAGTFLAVIFAQPLLLVVAIILQHHMAARFESSRHDDDEDEDEPAIGFLANVDRD
jgi:hypothetical protein